MDYPKMIYRGGSTASDQLIVQNEAEEASAEKDGFWAYDREPAKAQAATPAAPALPEDPKDKATAAEPKKPGPKPKDKATA